MPYFDKRLIYPEYSNHQVRKAGEKIRTNSLTPKDEEIVENWRSSHNHVLNTWLITLISRIKTNNVSAVPGQRLKRKSTIYDKLKRPGTKRMMLNRMYDIAGCRIVFENLNDLYDFRDSMIHGSRFKHKLKKNLCKNYIQTPKATGYRSIHDIYEYKSDPRKATEKNPARPTHWNGLYVEIQYRTKHQHAWATAVEIADIIKKSRTKFTLAAVTDQDQFFQYASEIIARAYEGKNSCLPHLTNGELIATFNSLNIKLNLLAILKSITAVYEDKDYKNKKALVMRLRVEDSKPIVEITPFKSLSEADKRYKKLEKEYPNDDTVLVKSDSFSNIKNIFRNYFADAAEFVQYMEDAIVAISEERILFDPESKRAKKVRQLSLFDDI